MAVIMAGGKGTRLQPYTMSIPKPLLPLGEIPIIEIVLNQLSKVGVNKVIIALGHMAPIFKISIGNGERFGINIDYVIEDTPRGTAGALQLIDNLEDHFIVMNGDLLTNFNIKKFYEEHLKRDAVASIAIHERSVNIDYGVVETDNAGYLFGYKEKPVIKYDVSMGINILSKKAVEFIPRTGKYDIPDLMTRLKDAGHKVFCLSSDCYWQDIGRFDDYQKASKDFVENPSFFLNQ